MGLKKGTPLTHDVKIDKALKYLADNIDTLIDTPWRKRWTGTQWDDIIVNAFALGKGAAAPNQSAFLSAGGLEILEFDGLGTKESLFGAYELWHGWREGTTIHVHLHWCPMTSASGNVKWNFEYSWVNVDGAFPAAQTMSVVVPTNGVAFFHHLAPFPEITDTTKKIGSVMMFRIHRDPTDALDTYGAGAGLMSIGIHVDNDSVGSDTLYNKTYGQKVQA